MVRGLFVKSTWTIRILPTRGNRGDDVKESPRQGIKVKTGLSSLRSIIKNPPCKAEDMKPDTTSSLKESSGAPMGVLDLGVLRCPNYSI